MMEQEAASASEPTDSVITEEIPDGSSEAQETADNAALPDIQEEQAIPETSDDGSVNATPLTPDEIASMFANL